MQTIFKFFLGLLLTFIPFLVIANTLQGWNSKELVSLYFHNSELQTQWAWAALSNYSFKGNESVLDFGSGDGKLSALMSFMVPKGNVVGTDVSQEMKTYAENMFPRSSYKNLLFIKNAHEDFSEETFSRKFDLVTLFCVLHLVSDPLKILKNIKSHMKSHAKMIVTHPIDAAPEFYWALTEELANQHLTLPASTPSSQAIRNPEILAKVFNAAGFNLNHIKIVSTRNGFGSKKELVDWLEGTLSGNWNIPAHKRRLFFSNLADRYLKYRPQDIGRNGFVYLTLSRIEVAAEKR